jgi:hypothetical protein
VFVDSGIQQAMCMQHIFFCVLDLQYFSTLSHKWHDLKKKLLNMKCLFYLQLLSKTFLILRKRSK